MDVTNSAVWFTVSFVLIAAIAIKTAKGRTMLGSRCTMPTPPVVDGISLIRLLHLLLTKGLRAMIHDQHKSMGSVFTVSFFGIKLTFLVGPEILSHFYQGAESEISHGNMLDFMVPMFGKEVGYGVDFTTRYEQIRFYSDALARPSKLRVHVDPMLQEVEDYFAKWGQDGVIDLKHELGLLLMLISSRCLLGKEVRDKMFDEIHTLFHELDNGMHISSVLFPYAPTPVNRRRDRAHSKLSQIFAEIVRSRRSSNQVEKDVLQNLIDSKYKDGRSTTEREVIGMIMLLLFGGKHNSTVAGTWTGAHLLNCARSLTAVVEEQKQLVRKYGNHVDYNVLLEMDTLHYSIKEALRMHPPAAIFFRKVHKKFTVQTKEGHEYEIPRGHTIASPILFNSNLPHIYKDPDVYDPSRFGRERQEDKIGGKFAYASFSCGRHTCVGEAYTYMQIKVVWSHLLRNFELKLISPFPETDWGKLVPEPKGKVMVGYKRRQLPNN
ncbi:unnamed protein product [Urochloa decumbens]|uniref:Obtusifoliol 14-alpha demethylase n=1 Tax=Urochloa decumbens TaxID=240449 RepID=A0ABC8VMB0_9POAL